MLVTQNFSTFQKIIYRLAYSKRAKNIAVSAAFPKSCHSGVFKSDETQFLTFVLFEQSFLSSKTILLDTLYNMIM